MTGAGAGDGCRGVVHRPVPAYGAVEEVGDPVQRFELVVPSLHQIFVDKVGAEAAVAQRIPDA